MVSKRKFKMYFAKWGGIMISVLFVTIFSIIGGIYLNSANKVDTTLAWVTQNLNLYSILPTEDNETLEQVTYHIVVGVNNPSDNDAVVSIDNLEIALEDITVKISPTNEWKQSIDPNDFKVFEGDFILNYDTLELLKSRGHLQLNITGNLSAKSSHAFVSRKASRPINLVTQAQISLSD